MFSKSQNFLIRVSSFAFGILLLAGCGRFLNEQKDTRQVLEIQDGSFTCLKKFPQQLSTYIAGNLHAEEVREAVDCGKLALDYFSKNTKGSLQDAYTPVELQKFLGKYFLKENNFSLTFASELFKVKKMLLGGSATTLSKVEIQKLVDLLEHLKEPLVTMAPEMPRLLAQENAVTLEQLNSSIKSWSDVLMVLVGNAELLGSQYSFVDLKNLMAELNTFLDGKVPAGMLKRVQDNAGLIESAKNIFLGEVAHFDGVKDWERTVKTLTGLHLEFLRYHYFLDQPATSAKVKMSVTTLIVDEGFKLLSDSLVMQQQARIPFKNLDGFLDQLASRNLLPLGLSARSYKNLYKMIILRMLDARRDRNDTRDFDALERSHFMALQHEWRVFKLHQSFFESLPYDSNDSIGFKELAVAMTAGDVEVRRTIEAYSSETLEQDRLWASWQEGRGLLLQKFPALYDRKGQALIIPRADSQRETRTSLIRWNTVRAISRLLMRGYGDKTISEESLKQWYADFREIGIEAKAFHPRAGNSGSRSFKEANFFTFHGDGNDQMDWRETFDFVSLMISGGMVSSENLRQGMTEAGCATTRLDVFGFPILREDCFKLHLRPLLRKNFGNLPGLLQEINRFTEPEWEQFYSNLMDASKTTISSAGAVETGDIRAAVMLLHYTESLMVVYDTDLSGSLNVEELRQAAPRFRSFMLQASPGLIQRMSSYSPTVGNAMVEDFFLYLVFRGQKPKPPLFDYLGTFQLQKKRNSLGLINRGKILRVFKVLKDEADKQ